MPFDPSERVVCPCGGSFTKSNKSKHFKTKWHTQLIKFIEENPDLTVEQLRTKCEGLKSPRYRHKVINVTELCSPLYIVTFWMSAAQMSDTSAVKGLSVSQDYNKDVYSTTSITTERDALYEPQVAWGSLRTIRLVVLRTSSESASSTNNDCTVS